MCIPSPARLFPGSAALRTQTRMHRHILCFRESERVLCWVEGLEMCANRRWHKTRHPAALFSQLEIWSNRRRRTATSWFFPISRRRVYSCLMWNGCFFLVGVFRYIYQQDVWHLFGKCGTGFEGRRRWQLDRCIEYTIFHVEICSYVGRIVELVL